jgi:hypothetical protein
MCEDDDVVRELERKLRFLSPQAYQFPPELIPRIVDLLSAAVSSPACEFAFQALTFPNIYKSCGRLFVKAHGVYSKFLTLLISDDLEKAARRAAWLALLHLVPAPHRPPQVTEAKSRLFDELALEFVDIVHAFRPLTTGRTQNITREWTAIVAATLLILLEVEFSDGDLPRNAIFFISLETYLCNLIVGFASAEFESFHATVYSMVAEEYRIFFPPRVMDVVSSIRRIDASSTKQEAVLALMLSKMHEDGRRKDTKYLFEQSQQSPLIERGLQIHGLPRAKQRRKGYIPQDRLVENTGPLVQASSSMANVRDFSMGYDTKRRSLFREICRKHADASLKAQRLAESGEAVANSDVASAFFYEKLERAVIKKHAESARSVPLPPNNDGPLTVDMTQLDPNVAWAILEDELMSQA